MEISPTITRIVRYVRPSYMRLPNATRFQGRLSFARKGRPYKTRTPTTINRARETTKRWRVLLPRELLDTLLANGSRRLASGLSYCCVVGKIDVVHESSTLFPFACVSLFFPGIELALPFRAEGLCFFSLFSSLLFYFILFLFLSRCQEHDMIGNIDYL